MFVMRSIGIWNEYMEKVPQSISFRNTFRICLLLNCFWQAICYIHKDNYKLNSKLLINSLITYSFMQTAKHPNVDQSVDIVSVSKSWIKKTFKFIYDDSYTHYNNGWWLHWIVIPKILSYLPFSQRNKTTHDLIQLYNCKHDQISRSVCC